MKTHAQTATSGAHGGCLNIGSKPKSRLGGLLCMLAALAILGSLIAAPGALAKPKKVTGAAGLGPGIAIETSEPEPPPKPQLMMFHGGSFLFEKRELI